MEIAWNPHASLHPEGPRQPRFFAGLDIGQMTDPTALAVLEREVLDRGTRVEGRFLLRYLERVPLMTPYPVMVEGVRQRLQALGEPCQLIVDATGVGRPVLDLFRGYDSRILPDAWQEQAAILRRPFIPIGITITNGERVSSERFDEWHVPKRLLIMGMQVAMQQGRLLVANALPEGPTFVKELQNFTWRPTKTNEDSYAAHRDGQHDDIILATAIGIWYAARFLPTGARPSQGFQRTYTGPGNPLRRAGALTTRRG